MSKGQETKAKIVARAAPLFNQRGLEGTSMSALMEATGLEKGGIYRHFPSKEAVAAEAFDYAWNLVREKRHEGLEGIPNSVDKVKKLVANFVEQTGPVPGGCPLLNSAIDSDDGSVVLRKRAERALEGWRDYLADIIRSGIGKREIESRIHPSDLATLVIASLEGALMMSRLTRNREALRLVADHLFDVLERSRSSKR